MLPKTDRAEILQEARQHIIALAAAQEWSQGEPTEAMRRALHEFGDADTLGPRLLEAWLKKKTEQTRACQTPAIRRRRLSIEAIKAAAWSIFLITNPAADTAIPYMLWFLGWIVASSVIGTMERRLLPGDFVSNASGFNVLCGPSFRSFTFRRRMQLQSELDAAWKGKAILPKGWFYGALTLQYALMAWIWLRTAHGKNWAEDDALKFISLFMPVYFAGAAGFIYKPRQRV